MSKQQLRIYLSSPVSGHRLDGVIRSFALAAQMIRQQGHIPVNPLEGVSEDAKEDGESRKRYMRADLKMLLSCDAIFFFGDWYRSEGCKLEYMVAKSCGLGWYDYKKRKVTEWTLNANVKF